MCDAGNPNPKNNVSFPGTHFPVPTLFCVLFSVKREGQSERTREGSGALMTDRAHAHPALVGQPDAGEIARLRRGPEAGRLPFCP